jgi:hypothetical protein
VNCIIVQIKRKVRQRRQFFYIFAALISLFVYICGGFWRLCFRNAARGKALAFREAHSSGTTETVSEAKP